MEYGIYFKSKYTTLQINTTLDWKKMIENKKWHRRKSPQGGWGMGSKEPIRRTFLLYAPKISVKSYESSFFLYMMKPISYKLPKTKITVKRETPGGIQMIQKKISNSSFSSSCYDW